MVDNTVVMLMLIFLAVPSSFSPQGTVLPNAGVKKVHRVIWEGSCPSPAAAGCSFCHLGAGSISQGVGAFTVRPPAGLGRFCGMHWCHSPEQNGNSSLFRSRRQDAEENLQLNTKLTVIGSITNILVRSITNILGLLYFIDFQCKDFVAFSYSMNYFYLSNKLSMVTFSSCNLWKKSIPYPGHTQ